MTAPKKFNIDIPAKSVGYMLACGGIMIVLGLGLFSFHRYNAVRMQDNEKIQEQIKEQKGLAQVYQLLQGVSEKKENRALPNPAKTTLPRKNANLFQETFRAETGKAGLMTISLTPDVNAPAAGSQNLIYEATIKGEFANFRKLLSGLGRISYIDRIEEIHIKQYGDSMEFKLRLWIALARE